MKRSKENLKSRMGKFEDAVLETEQMYRLRGGDGITPPPEDPPTEPQG